MKVRAKYQLAYKSKSYKGGEEFDLDKEDFSEYKNDVIEIKTPDRKNPTTKGDDLTKSQIMEKLDEQGIEYSSNELKADLLDKLK